LKNKVQQNFINFFYNNCSLLFLLNSFSDELKIISLLSPPKQTEFQFDRRIQKSDRRHCRADLGPRGFRQAAGRDQLLDGRRASRHVDPQRSVREHLLRRQRFQRLRRFPADRFALVEVQEVCPSQICQNSERRFQS